MPELNVQFVHDGEAPLGTGGAVKNAFYTCGLDGPAFVLYGDSYLDVNYSEILRYYNSSGRPCINGNHEK